MSRLARLYAEANGYFWLPCPLCGQMFGGHEWGDIDGKSSTIPDGTGRPGAWRAICPNCTIAGRGNDGDIPHQVVRFSEMRHKP